METFFNETLPGADFSEPEKFKETPLKKFGDSIRTRVLFVCIGVLSLFPRDMGPTREMNQDHMREFLSRKLREERAHQEMVKKIGEKEITKIGIASHYGEREGCILANGEVYYIDSMVAAHRTLPLGTLIKVTHGDSSVVVRIADHGPEKWTGRILDLSYGAFKKLANPRDGVVKVKYEVIKLPHSKKNHRKM